MCQRFGGTCYFLLHGRLSCNRGKDARFLRKFGPVTTKLHGITSQKTTSFIAKSVGNSVSLQTSLSVYNSVFWLKPINSTRFNKIVRYRGGWQRPQGSDLFIERSVYAPVKWTLQKPLVWYVTISRGDCQRVISAAHVVTKGLEPLPRRRRRCCREEPWVYTCQASLPSTFT